MVHAHVRVTLALVQVRSCKQSSCQTRPQGTRVLQCHLQPQASTTCSRGREGRRRSHTSSRKPFEHVFSTNLGTFWGSHAFMTFFDFMARSCLSPQCFAALVHVKGVARKVVDWCSKTPRTIVETLMSTICSITLDLEASSWSSVAHQIALRTLCRAPLKEAICLPWPLRRIPGLYLSLPYVNG